MLLVIDFHLRLGDDEAQGPGGGEEVRRLLGDAVHEHRQGIRAHLGASKGLSKSFSPSQPIYFLYLYLYLHLYLIMLFIYIYIITMLCLLSFGAYYISNFKETLQQRQAQRYASRAR